MKKSQDTYMEPEVYHHNNCIVRVYRSISERTRRMEAIKKAAVDLVIATERAKQKKSRSFND